MENSLKDETEVLLSRINRNCNGDIVTTSANSTTATSSLTTTTSFPIMLVPNINKLFMPPLQNHIQYILPFTQENLISPVNDVEEDCCSSSSGIRIKSFLDNCGRLQAPTTYSLSDIQKSIVNDLKSVSPMQFFNIQEQNDGASFLGSEDSSPNMYRKICESALLHESSKDVTLISEPKQQAIPLMTESTTEDIDKNDATSSFVESSEMNEDLFVPIVEMSGGETLNSCSNEATKIEITASNCRVNLTRINCKLEKLDKNDCQVNQGLDSSEESDELAKVQQAFEDIKEITAKEIHDNSNCSETETTIVVHLPEDPFSKEELLINKSKEEMEYLRHKPFPLLLPTETLDVSLIPIMPMDSLLFGNFALLPSSTSPIKFQVIEDDGSVKRISVNPVCQTDDPLTVCTMTEQDDSDGTMAYPSPPVVNEILRNVSEKPFRCELCSATFNRLGNYTRHKKIHMVPTKEDQRFHCDVCGKHFIQRCDLTRHRHIHSGTEPHRCGTCGKGYIRHSDLVIHQRFHNKEKPFACSHCTKGFSQRGDLNRHLRSIHLQVKPLTCGHCHKKFAKEATLIRHMQITHRDIILNSLAKCTSEGVGLTSVKQESCVETSLCASNQDAFASLDPS